MGYDNMIYSRYLYINITELYYIYLFNLVALCMYFKDHPHNYVIYISYLTIEQTQINPEKY